MISLSNTIKLSRMASAGRPRFGNGEEAPKLSDPSLLNPKNPPDQIDLNPQTEPAYLPVKPTDLQNRDESHWPGGQSPRALHDEAYVDLMHGNPDAAIQKIDRTFQLHAPDRAHPLHDFFLLPQDTLNTLGIALALKGDTTSAIGIFNKILTDKPEMGYVRMNMANAVALNALQEGNVEKAQTAQNLYQACNEGTRNDNLSSPRALYQNQMVFYTMLGMADAAADFSQALAQVNRWSGKPVLQNLSGRRQLAAHSDPEQALAQLAENKLPEETDLSTLFQFETEDYTKFLANPAYPDKYKPPVAEPPSEQAKEPETTTTTKRHRFRRIRNAWRWLRAKPLLPKPVKPSQGQSTPQPNPQSE